MAFFKFLFPGQANASSAQPEVVGAGPGESIESLRRRARHRLMGAVVLVSAAVVGFPMLFDTQPRPVAMDTPVLMPDRFASGPLLVTPPATPALMPDTSPLPVQAGLDADEEQVPEPTIASAKPQPTAPAGDTPVVPMGQAKSPPIAAKTDVKAAAANKRLQADGATNTAAQAKARDDGSKALALLEGRSPNVAKATVAERHVVQVGAFTDPAKVREARRKLEQAGLTTFIQVIQGQNGQSTTRVRVGPFSSREEAEKTAARIRQLSFEPAVLRL